MQVRVGTAVVIFRLDEKEADGGGVQIRSYGNGLIRAGRPSRDIKGKKEEGFTNVSVLSGQVFHRRSAPIYSGNPSRSTH